MDESRLLIVGADGQLGKALQVKYPQASALNKDQLDITKKDAVSNYDWSKVDVILNAAAYTDVDGAETPEGKTIAQSVNDMAVGNLAGIANEKSLILVHVSTDYVFDGTQKIHTEDEPFKPLGVYGQTKAAGEKKAAQTPKHYILRSSWVIGDGSNFARAILAAAKQRAELSVVADQFGRPTFTIELTRIIDFLLNAGAPYGTYNASNGGDIVSWANLARAILKEAGSKTRVVDTTTDKYFAGKVASKRPKYSSLDLSKLEALGFKPTDWRDDLRQYINKELKK